MGDEDDPWQAHQTWFPNCVYVRFLVDGNELRPATADGHNMSDRRCIII